MHDIQKTTDCWVLYTTVPMRFQVYNINPLQGKVGLKSILCLTREQTFVLHTLHIPFTVCMHIHPHTMWF